MSLGGFVEPLIENPYTGVTVLILCSDDSGVYQCVGSGVIIGPNLLITAKHIIMEFWDALGDGSEILGHKSADFSLHALAMKNTPGSPAVWRIKHCWPSSRTDIAVLGIDPNDTTESYKWNLPLLQLVPPSVGTNIEGLGYTIPEFLIESRGGITERLIKAKPMTTRGIVQKIFPEKVDCVLKPFPCIQTNAHIVGAMSGGPVFNIENEGELLGLITSSYELTETETEPISFVASLWPAMSTQVDLSKLYPYQFKEEKIVPLLELARMDYIHAIDHTRIDIITGNDGFTGIGILK